MVHITVTNNLGCIDDTTRTVVVHPNPIADFTYDANCDFVVDFTDLSIHNNTSIASWSWNFGDGGNASVQNPTHTFPGAGTYNVTLIVTNNNNCIDSVTLPVVVPEPPVKTTQHNSPTCPSATAHP